VDAALGVRLLASSARRAAHDLYVVEAEPGPARVAEAHIPGTRAVLLMEHARGGGQRRGPARRYSVLTFGSACWVTGTIARKCSTGSSIRGWRASAVSSWPDSRSASPYAERSSMMLA
jgi:hypothetical protein